VHYCSVGEGLGAAPLRFSRVRVFLLCEHLEFLRHPTPLERIIRAPLLGLRNIGCRTLAVFKGAGFPLI